MRATSHRAPRPSPPGFTRNGDPETAPQKPLQSAEAAALRAVEGGSVPDAVAPHPLFRCLPDPGLELPHHAGQCGAYVGRRVGRTWHAQLLDLDPEAALGADPNATGHPQARAHAPSDDGGNGLRAGVTPEEGYRDPAAIVLIADDPKPAATAYEIRNGPGGAVIVAMIPFDFAASK